MTTIKTSGNYFLTSFHVKTIPENECVLRNFAQYNTIDLGCFNHFPKCFRAWFFSQLSPSVLKRFCVSKSMYYFIMNDVYPLLKRKMEHVIDTNSHLIYVSNEYKNCHVCKQSLEGFPTVAYHPSLHVCYKCADKYFLYFDVIPVDFGSSLDKLMIYAVNFNVLQMMSGVGRLKYSS